MAIDRGRYHGWQGELGSPWRGTLALVRVSLVQLFRRKLYWGVLAACLVQFVFFFLAIYAVTQTQLPPQVQQRVLEVFGFASSAGPAAASAAASHENGYTLFIERQSLVVMILLAFSGSLLVGSDFRNEALPFYLSRRIDRKHYVAGKVLSVATVVSLLTTLPALILFVEFGLFTGSIDYWLENWRIPLAVLVYGSVLCLVLGVLLVTVSAYLVRSAPIAIVWSSLFLLLRRLAVYLHGETGEDHWRLLDPWFDIHEVGRMLFFPPTSHDERHIARLAAALLVVVCGACLVALSRRVRAVEVVV
jgi:hypothetical protein